MKNRNKLSKSEKIELIKKEAPELLNLLKDFKEKVVEVKDVLEPILQK